MSEDELMSFIDVAKAVEISLSTADYLNAKGLVSGSSRASCDDENQKTKQKESY
jgi:uncharacterized protein YggL (DUF469 family)